MNGKQALDKIKSRITDVMIGQSSNYKLIFLDYSMQDMEGPEVALNIRNMIDEAGLS